MEKRAKKENNGMEKFNSIKESAADLLKKSTEFDTRIVEENSNYFSNINDAFKNEEELLRLNMEKAETEQERKEVRDQQERLRNAKCDRDDRNKEFYNKETEGQRTHHLKILTGLVVVSGLAVKYRKPILDLTKSVGQKVITG